MKSPLFENLKRRLWENVSFIVITVKRSRSGCIFPRNFVPLNFSTICLLVYKLLVLNARSTYILRLAFTNTNWKNVELTKWENNQASNVVFNKKTNHLFNFSEALLFLEHMTYQYHSEVRKEFAKASKLMKMPWNVPVIPT